MFIDQSNRVQYDCQFCKAPLNHENYESHCSEVHGLDINQWCVWCLHKEPWLEEKSTMYGVEDEDDMTRQDHQRNCIRLFLQYPPSKDWKKSYWFGDKYIQRYRETADTADWYHVIYRRVAKNALFQVLDNDDGQTFQYNFHHYCDGGHYDDGIPQYVMHYHDIVYSSPKGHFEKDVWSKIELPGFPVVQAGTYALIWKIEILNEDHLIRTLNDMYKTVRMKCDL